MKSSTLGFWHLDNELVKLRHTLLKFLSDSDLLNDGICLATVFEWITIHGLPVAEDALWDGSTMGHVTQFVCKSERLINWQVSLHNNHWCAVDRLFTDNLSSFLTHHLVDGAGAIGVGLDFALEYWLQKDWLSSQLSSEEGIFSHILDQSIFAVRWVRDYLGIQDVES